MSVDLHPTFAYSYHDPLLEPIPDEIDWGQEVDQIYRDLGDRQQLEQLLQRCQTCPDALVLVRRLAELGDTVAELSARLAALEALGVHLIAVEEPIGTQGIDDLDQTLRRSDLLALLHQLQQQQRQRKLQRGHARNRIQALPPPGKAPYGYRRGKDRYIVDRATAPIVKDFFEHFLLYASLRGSVRYLQKKYNKKIS
ncbi:MAG TPA: recombinase family protein, partial [Allocoleopsis sp.]